MDRPVRVGSFSAFYGDRASALSEVAAAGVDVLCGDYLAEVTMLVLAKQRAKDPAMGYATTFLRHLESALPTVRQAGIRVVTNAGGLNPHGLAAAVAAMAARHDTQLSVAVVDGDDVTASIPEWRSQGTELVHLDDGTPLSAWPHEVLTANAYLGGWGVTRALQSGADVVICGRVADASLISGAAAWWHEWDVDDWDPLAGAVIAGHIIECGTQATGGMLSTFAELGDLGVPGFPIAEIAADGSSVITKPAGSGGIVNVDSVTAQLLYEVGSPRYLNPDVVARLDTVEVSQIGPDRVAVGVVHGEPPPPTTKVAVTAIAGWRNECFVVVTGLDAEAKAAWFERQLRAALEGRRGLRTLEVELIGRPADDPPTRAHATAFLRCVATGDDERAVGRAFSSAVVELAVATYPGFFRVGPPSNGSSFGTYWPGLVAQDAVAHRVTLADGTSLRPPAPSEFAPVEPLPPAPDLPAYPDGPTTRRPLGDLLRTRSGDKGGTANLGVWVASDDAYAWLRSYLDVDELRRLVPEADGLDIRRHELPLLRAINFEIVGLLGEGATANTLLDRQAKALGEYLRARHAAVPAALLPVP